MFSRVEENQEQSECLIDNDLENVLDNEAENCDEIEVITS